MTDVCKNLHLHVVCRELLCSVGLCSLRKPYIFPENVLQSWASVDVDFMEDYNI